MASNFEKRLERFESEREITRLIYNYCHGLDRKDNTIFLDIWHDDAEWDTGGSPFGSFSGKAEIEKGVKENMWPAYKHGHHWTINTVIDIDGKKARSISNFTFQGEAADGSAMVVAGTYHDEFTHKNRRWGISKRSIETHHFSPLPGVSFATPEWAL